MDPFADISSVVANILALTAIGVSFYAIRETKQQSKLSDMRSFLEESLRIASKLETDLRGIQYQKALFFERLPLIKSDLEKVKHLNPNALRWKGHRFYGDWEKLYWACNDAERHLDREEWADEARGMMQEKLSRIQQLVLSDYSPSAHLALERLP